MATFILSRPAVTVWLKVKHLLEFLGSCFNAFFLTFFDLQNSGRWIGACWWVLSDRPVWPLILKRCLCQGCWSLLLCLQSLVWKKLQPRKEQRQQISSKTTACVKVSSYVLIIPHSERAHKFKLTEI